MQKTRKISVEAIKSKIITSEDNLTDVILKALEKSKIQNGDILAITSKVVAVTQSRFVKFKNEKEFNTLVKKEADAVIGGEKVTLTLKNGIFTPWSGIDRSNTQKGTAVLWPKHPHKTAQQIRNWLKKTYRLQKVGVIIVDSFCAPRRKGVIGIALAHAGFRGVTDKRGTKDLYANTLKFTQEAIADSLATTANLVMGQGNEQMPFALIHNAPVTFINKKIAHGDLIMDEKECLYGPLYRQKMSR